MICYTVGTEALCEHWSDTRGRLSVDIKGQALSVPDGHELFGMVASGVSVGQGATVQSTIESRVANVLKGVAGL